MILAFFLFWGLNSVHAQAPTHDVHLLLSDIAGMSMPDEQKKGMGRELVEQALAAAGLTYRVEFLPWARLLATAKRDPKALMLPLSRTKAREPHYQWIRPVFTAEMGFVSITEAVDDYEIAKRLGGVGVWQHTLFQTILEKQGFDDPLLFAGDERLGKLFESGRIKAWFGELNESRYRLKNYQNRVQGKALSFYFGRPLSSTPAWLVAARDFDSAKISKIRAALNALYLSGAADKIYMKYYGFSGLGDF